MPYILQITVPNIPLYVFIRIVLVCVLPQPMSSNPVMNLGVTSHTYHHPSIETRSSFTGNEKINE